jgi:hypothetical protein
MLCLCKFEPAIILLSAIHFLHLHLSISTGETKKIEVKQIKNIYIKKKGGSNCGCVHWTPILVLNPGVVV